LIYLRYEGEGKRKKKKKKESEKKVGLKKPLRRECEDGVASSSKQERILAKKDNLKKGLSQLTAEKRARTAPPGLKKNQPD